jgi:hypothetical protein
MLIWAILYLPRPFRLGFYHDDWSVLIEPTRETAAFSLQRFNSFEGINSSFAARPLDGLLMFLTNSVCATSTFAYHAWAAILALVAALSLRAWFGSMLREGEFPDRYFAADFGAIFWLSIPWSVASTGWPVLAPAAMCSQIFFTESMRRVLPPRRAGTRDLAVLGLGLLASYLIYEPFYFQFFVVAVYYLIFQRPIFRSRAMIIWFLSVGLFTQLVVIGFNRYVASLHAMMGKTVPANWFALFRMNLERLPYEFQLSLGEAAELWIDIVWILAGVAIVLVIRGFLSPALSRPTVHILGVLLMGVFAATAAVLTFSLAGYGISSVGVMGRSLQGVSWAVAIIAFSLSSLLILPHGDIVRGIFLTALLSIVFTNCVWQAHAVDVWAFVWHQEEEILKRAPTDKIKTLSAGDRVLYIGPSSYRGMVIFGANWDISAAVFSLPALSHDRKNHEGNMIHSASDYNWTWDGKSLTQERPGSWSQMFPATGLYIWNYDRGEMSEAKAGYRLMSRN